jgi:hypothetical protein
MRFRDSDSEDFGRYYLPEGSARAYPRIATEFDLRKNSSLESILYFIKRQRCPGVILRIRAFELKLSVPKIVPA